MCQPVCKDMVGCCNYTIQAFKENSNFRLIVITFIAIIALLIIASIYL